MNFLPLKEITEQNNVNSKDAELYLITHERGWIYNGAASLERSESILILLSRQRLAAGADENRPALMFRIELFYTCAAGKIKQIIRPVPQLQSVIYSPKSSSHRSRSKEHAAATHS